MVSSSTQTTYTETLPNSIAASENLPPSKPTPQYITYSKGVQTEPVDELTGIDGDAINGEVQNRTGATEDQDEIHENIRASLRKEIEEELRAAENGDAKNISTVTRERFPLRALSPDELNAVTSSDDFVSFIERSSKSIERILDEQYDVLTDYTRATTLDAEADYVSKTSKSLREMLQFYSSNHSRRRMITDLHFSPHFPELLLTSYTKNPSAPNEPNGLCLVWNIHAPSRPEYVFYASSDVLTARFSPFHPNLIIGGCYSGQICIWDTRTCGRTGHPAQRTPPTGAGSHLSHTHPVYSLNVIGTPNAHNIITADTDGIVCSWSTDMLAQAQEYLVLHTPPPSKTDDIAPTSISFPSADPTFFLVGSEEGTIYPCHRYDRAGARAGVDGRLAYRGHTAPVMSTQFHPGRGPIDLGDIMLSSSSDWSLKLWRVKSAASSSGVAVVTSTTSDDSSTIESVKPILDIPREDLVYDAKWSPNKPSVFACVTGAGDLEVFDLNYDTEVPVNKATPSRGKNGSVPFKGLSKIAWESRNGRYIATGGLDGVVTLFEVGRGLAAAPGEASVEEWMDTKKLINKLESMGNT